MSAGSLIATADAAIALPYEQALPYPGWEAYQRRGVQRTNSYIFRSDYSGYFLGGLINRPPTYHSDQKGGRPIRVRASPTTKPRTIRDQVGLAMP